MKNKLFALIFISLLLLTLVVLILQGAYFENERMLLLDQQIRNSAENIVDSEFANLGRYDSSKADRIISNELGTDRVGKFFVVWDGENRKVYESLNILELAVDIPRSPKTVTMTVGNNLIRAINFELPNVPERTMQVGIIVDKSFIDWSFINRSLLIYVVILLICVFVAAMILLTFLFQPIHRIAEELQRQTGSTMAKAEFDLQEIDRISKMYPEGKRDEFGDLIGSIKTLMVRINTNLKFQKFWAFQMAHEIKTPLFIVREALNQMAEQDRSENLLRAQKSLDRSHLIISDFLNWAEVATLQSKPALFAIKIQDVMIRLLSDFNKSFPQRIDAHFSEDFTVISNPNHLDQLVSNLIMNALVHTEGGVEVFLSPHQTLVIRDFGQGIDPKILNKIGSPFNKSSKNISYQGSGLGLAWIKTLCDLYGWKLDLKSDSQGTEIRVQFPEV